MEQDDIMMAEEPMVVRPMASYADVMGYLHSIRITPQVKESVGRRLLLEVTEPYLAKAFARLDDLSQLCAGWDGRGAKKISYYVLKNLRNVLLISDNEDWKDWMISPDTNGAVGLQSKRGIATISVGDKEFSYYRETDKGEEGESHVEFSPEKLLELMRRIA
jgi:hypothetical protein